MGKYTFTKAERLCSKSEIEELFTKGSHFYLYPFKVVYELRQEHGVKVLFSVPKRNFKRAVDRNRIKRLMREGYRLNKIIPESSGLHIIFVYTQKVQPEFIQVSKAIKSALRKVITLTKPVE